MWRSAPREDPTPLSPEESAARWDSFGLDRLSGQHPLSYFSERWRFEEPLYWEIMKRAPARGSVLEVGAGTGVNLLWLAARGYRAVGVEYRPKLVDVARDWAHRLRLDCTFHVGDAFDLGAYRDFDVAFSLGMVEHWAREDSVRAIREQASCARTVIVEIPTPHTSHTGRITDEHFYSGPKLRAMCEEAGLRDVRTFGYGQVPSVAGRAAALALPGGAIRAAQRVGWLSLAVGAVGTSGISNS